MSESLRKAEELLQVKETEVARQLNVMWDPGLDSGPGKSTTQDIIGVTDEI